MKNAAVYACLAIVMGCGRTRLEERPPKEFAIPEDLKSTTPEVPTDQNNLTRFFTAFGKLPPEKTKVLLEAREQQGLGRRVEDEDLLRELLERHRQADGMLKPPLAFASDTEPSAMTSLFFLYQEAEVLARQAMFENDYPEADRILGDVFRWSRLLRNAQPNLLQTLISRYGWQVAFNALLQDWQNHENQSKRLAEIETIFQDNRIETKELVEALKSDVRWWISMGGVQAMLRDETYAGTAMIYLKPPFNELSSSDLLKLPYDRDADFQREVADTREILDCLKRNTPVSRWPGYEVSATGRTLADYAKRPNGLGDLFHEHHDPSVVMGFWGLGLSRNPLLEACLLWLKQEQRGEPVTESAFNGFRDPVDGKPLTIDLERRIIRSRGLNLKADPPDPELGPLPFAGFFTSGDDLIIIVPRWKAKSIKKPDAP